MCHKVVVFAKEGLGRRGFPFFFLYAEVGPRLREEEEEEEEEEGLLKANAVN